MDERATLITVIDDRSPANACRPPAARLPPACRPPASRLPPACCQHHLLGLSPTLVIFSQIVWVTWDL